jgi:hypothetical protein
MIGVLQSLVAAEGSKEDKLQKNLQSGGFEAPGGGPVLMAEVKPTRL